ncbi:MAG: hypothetical protein AB7Q97_16280 [Gammaproteobacteria bacterium]
MEPKTLDELLSTWRNMQEQAWKTWTGGAVPNPLAGAEGAAATAAQPLAIAEHLARQMFEFQERLISTMLDANPLASAAEGAGAQWARQMREMAAAAIGAQRSAFDSWCGVVRQLQQPPGAAASGPGATATMAAWQSAAAQLVDMQSAWLKMVRDFGAAAGAPPKEK